MKQLSADKIAEILAMAREKKTAREISRTVKVSVSSVHKYAQNNERSLLCNPKGAKRKIYPRFSRLLKREVERGNVSTAIQGVNYIRTNHNLNISKSTVTRTFKRLGFVSRKKIKKPLLTKGHRLTRRVFAHEYRYYSHEDWSNVIFSDESMIRRLDCAGNQCVWVQKDVATLSERRIQEMLQNGGGGFLVWGCFSARGIGRLHCIEEPLNAKKYIDILRHALAQSLVDLNYSSDWLFMQDNAPVHTAARVKKYMKRKRIKILPWPAKSPDLNPIENLWALLKYRLYRRYTTPAENNKELWKRVAEVWASITPETCENLVKSMPNRLGAVRRARGGPISY